MPKSVLNCTLTVSQGKYAFDPVSKVLSWDVGKMEAQRASPNMRGTVKHIFFVPIYAQYIYYNFLPS